MALSKTPYKGTRDFFPEQMRLRNYIFSKMAEVSELFAYEPYDGPLLEELDLYRAKSGEELINDQVYNFVDRGEREVAIRPEMTPTVARMVAQIHREVSKPLRWYAIPNLMRYEKPQKGRLREFWQYNADIFGAPESLGDLEIIQLAISIMKSFGANNEHFEILINSRRFVDYVFTGPINLNPEMTKKLYKLIDKKNKMPAEKFSAEVNQITNDAKKTEIFEKYVSIGSMEEIETFFHETYTGANKEEEFTKTLKPLMDLFSQLVSLGLQDYIKFDPSIVRGLDYYTDVVFEIFDKHPENRRAIAGGGAYANLLAIFGETPLPGIGFGMGEVPLTDFLTTHKLLPSFAKQNLDILIAYLDPASEQAAFEVAQKLRDSSIKVEVYLGEAKPKKIFSHSDKKEPHFLLMLGSNEIQTGEMQIKDLKTKAIHKINFSDVDKMIELIKGSR
jgi:histidyl-tRNA synthetase